MRCSRLAAAVLLVLLVTGCGADAGDRADGSAGRDPEPAASSEPGPLAEPAIPGMTGLAIRLRTDLAEGGLFHTRITNTGTEPFTVLALRLDSPGFEPLDFVGNPATFPASAVVDLPTSYGAAVCSEGVEVDPVYAALQLQRPGQSVQEVRLPLAAPDDIIDRIHTEQCDALALQAQVGVSLEGDFATTDADGHPVVEAELVLARRDSIEDIVIAQTGGSVLFDLDLDPSANVLELAGQDAELRVPVRLRNTTCEPHVLAETKQPFLFDVLLSFGADDPVSVRLDPTQSLQDALWAYVQSVCG